METIGALEAKTYFSELLQRVERGEEITITRHGKMVAKLVPAIDPAVEARVRRECTLEQSCKLRKRYSLGGLVARDLINEGRK